MATVSLRRNFTWTFAANVIYAVCQWLMLVVLAQVGNTSMVGQFGLALAITAPIVLFANLGLRQLQATDAKGQFTFPVYFALRLVMLGAAAVVIAGVVFASGYGLETALVILIMGLAKFAESISDLYYGVLQFREHMDRIARSMIVRGLVSLLVFALAAVLFDSVLAAVSALALVWLAIAATIDRRNATSVLQAEWQREDSSPAKPVFDRAQLTVLFAKAFPLGLAIMLISLGTNIPRYFVEGYSGRAALGVFVALTYPLVATTTVVIALGQSASPRMARSYAEGDRAGFAAVLKRLVLVGTGMGALGILGALVLGEPVLDLLYGSEYAAHAEVFVWLMVGSAISDIGGFMGFAMTAAGLLKIQPLLLTISCLVCAALAFLWVPDEGLIGAAWAYTCAQAVHLAMTSVVVLRSIRPLPAPSRAEEILR